MVLIRLMLAALFAVSLAIGIATPGVAHKNHQEAVAVPAATDPPGNAGAAAGHAGMAMDEAPPPGTIAERAVAWLGKMHPAGVHFPIALFPVSFALLALARRREGVVAVVRWLVMIAGIAAAGAALMGWVSAGFAMSDTDPIQSWHRWIGTGLAAAGLAAALWAWRRPRTTGSAGMLALTGAISLAILIQGALGGAITHGLEHMRF